MRGRLGVAVGLVLVLLGGASLASEFGLLPGTENLVWTLIFGAGGLIFLTLALGRERHWWAVIPTCVFLSLAGFLYLSANELIPGDIVTGGFLFFGFSMPFWLILAFQGRAAWWAAIPAGVLLFVALAVGLESLVGETWTGTTMIWGVAVPFWVIYLLDRERWWALIPAGAMLTFGFIPLVADAWPPGPVIGLVFWGIAVTFLLIYLLSGRRKDVAWALWPAGGCALVGALGLVLGPWFDWAWPVLLIAGGVVLLVLIGIRRRS